MNMIDQMCSTLRPLMANIHVKFVYFVITRFVATCEIILRVVTYLSSASGEPPIFWGLDNGGLGNLTHGLCVCLVLVTMPLLCSTTIHNNITCCSLDIV